MLLSVQKLAFRGNGAGLSDAILYCAGEDAAGRLGAPGGEGAAVITSTSQEGESASFLFGLSEWGGHTATGPPLFRQPWGPTQLRTVQQELF